MQRQQQATYSTIMDVIDSYTQFEFENEIQQKSQEEQSFLSLFSYIRRNKTLLNKLGVRFDPDKEVFSTFESEFQKKHAKDIARFEQAIHQGKLESNIFKYSEGLTYCLLLLKERKIPFLQAMTIYSIMLARGQFSKKQEEQFIESENKYSVGPITFGVKKMVIGDQLSQAGEFYLDYLAKLGLPHFNPEAFKTHLLSLPPSEQWLTGLTYKKDNYADIEADSEFRPIELLINVLSSNQDHGLFPASFYGDKSTIHIPSFSMIQFLLGSLSPNHMKLRFGFGKVGANTLYKSHSSNEHFIPLYHPDVKSNMVSAHNFHCGPFMVLLHDVSHTFWASNLSLKERMFILNDFLPVIKRLNDFLKEHMLIDDYALDYAIFQLNDFEMVGFDPRNLYNYLYKTFFRYVENDFFEYAEAREGKPLILGEGLPDKLHLTIKHLMRTEDFNEKERAIYRFLLDRIYPDVDNVVHNENRKIIENIRHLPTLKDYQSLPPYCQQKIKNIDWSAWRDMLTKWQATPEKLWDAITSNTDRYKEYLLLSRYAGFKFIYPYLPYSNQHILNFSKLVNDFLLIKHGHEVPLQKENKNPSRLKRPNPGFFEPAPKWKKPRKQTRAQEPVPSENKQESRLSKK